MTKERNAKTTNRFLWQARQRSGLPQKTIAYLLGRKFTDEISRYENGQRIPTLQTALKLEIIYHVPVRLLFYEIYRNCNWQISEKSGRAGKYLNDLQSAESLASQLKQNDYCTYAELLNTPNLPQFEKDRIRKHLIYLANTINKVEGIEN